MNTAFEWTDAVCKAVQSKFITNAAQGKSLKELLSEDEGDSLRDRLRTDEGCLSRHWNWNVLHHAVSLDDAEAAGMLIEAGCDVNGLMGGINAFFRAKSQNNAVFGNDHRNQRTRIVDEVPPPPAELWKSTPLIVAAHFGCAEAAGLLLEHGADPTARSSAAGGQTPEEIALERGHYEVAYRLSKVKDRFSLAAAIESVETRLGKREEIVAELKVAEEIREEIEELQEAIKELEGRVGKKREAIGELKRREGFRSEAGLRKLRREIEDVDECARQLGKAIETSKEEEEDKERKLRKQGNPLVENVEGGSISASEMDLPKDSEEEFA